MLVPNASSRHSQAQVLKVHACQSIDLLITRGSALYQRQRDLPRLCPSLPGHGPAETAEEIIARLKRALMRERQRGVAGHWSYNLLRHMQLAQALRAEEQAATTKNAAPSGTAS